LKAFFCNRCHTFEKGEPAVQFYYTINMAEKETQGDLCGECELQFIKFLKKPNAN